LREIARQDHSAITGRRGDPPKWSDTSPRRSYCR
jgi:hypothetical protein